MDPPSITLSPLLYTQEIRFVAVPTLVSTATVEAVPDSSAYLVTARFPRYPGAAGDYGFYHIGIANPAQSGGFGPGGKYCRVAALVLYYNGPANDGTRVLYVLNPDDPSQVGIAQFPSQSADAHDNRACALDGRNSQISVSTDGSQVEFRAAIVFKPWFTGSTKSVYIQAAECCWVPAVWEYKTSFTPTQQVSTIAPSNGSDHKRTFFASFPYPRDQAGRFFELRIAPDTYTFAACHVLVAGWVGGVFLVDGTGNWRPNTAPPTNDVSFAGLPNGMWLYYSPEQVWPPANTSLANTYCRVTVNPTAGIHVWNHTEPDPNVADGKPLTSYYLYETTNEVGTPTTNIRIMVEMLPTGGFSGPQNVYLRTWDNVAADGWHYRGVWNVQ
jgi:hypothetical protein